MAVMSGLCLSALHHAHYLFTLYMLITILIWGGLRFNDSHDDTPQVPDNIYFTVKGPPAQGMDLGALMFQYAALLGIGARNRVRPVWPANSKLQEVFHFHEPDVVSTWKIEHVLFWKDQDIDTFLQESFAIQEVACPDCFLSPSFLSKFRNTTLQGAFQSYIYFQGYEHLLEEQFQFKTSVFNYVSNFYKLNEFDKTAFFIGVDFDSLTVQRTSNFFVESFIERGLNYIENTLPSESHVRIIVTTSNPTWLLSNSMFVRLQEEWSYSTWIRDVTVASDGTSLARLALLWACDRVLVCGGATPWWGAWGASQDRGAEVLYCSQDTVEDGYYPATWIPL